MMKTVSIALSMMVLAGCATTTSDANRQTKVSDQRKAVPLSLADDDAASDGFGALADASLPAKECGMVLWTLEGNRPAAVFRYVTGKDAMMNLGGADVTLKRIDYNGASGYGIYERQKFQNTDGIVVEVSAKFGLGFSGGSYLEQGVVKVTDNSGWSMVSPTAGIAGCRN
ncbi:polysaccharide deacetylase family protein [Hyphococcus lacteus]|uniref:Lipoprotein n=1 Tax=Hyphococcus lacteus TaxID=3143536 RepID=A0ABV3Z5Y7_9PROT